MGRRMEVWWAAREQLGVLPIAEGHVRGETPLYAERYLYRDIEKTIAGFGAMAMITQLGGSRVNEGEAGRWRTQSLPSQSLLVPPHYATHWHYTGMVDFAVFYFSPRPEGLAARLQALTAATQGPLQFNDTLVCATALQLVNELQKGRGADERFMAMLSNVMLEQAYRALTTPETAGGRRNPAQLVRLQGVLKYIREHLADDLPAPLLARMADLSLAHFRRLFLEAMGVPLHRYILAARIEQARTLLTMTSLPIVQIAQDCGFSSQSHLTASFRAAHAATPAEFRAQLMRQLPRNG